LTPEKGYLENSQKFYKNAKKAKPSIIKAKENHVKNLQKIFDFKSPFSYF